MTQSSPIINVLTFGLPSSVTRPIYLEYNSRKGELDRIWANPKNNYQELQDYVSTVEALLAISLFYRHVMGHIQGAVSFYKSVNRKVCNEKECAIQVGRTVLDKEQYGHLLSSVASFVQLQSRYHLTPDFFQYSDTIQFLRNCKDLFNVKEYEENDPV